MDLAQALKLAGSESKAFVRRPVAKCRLERTGLLVLVYRKDTGESIAGADVSAGGKGGRTDANGIAHDYLPCAPGKYDVSVTALPDHGKIYATPYPADRQTVFTGFCPVCSLPVDPRKYWVKVRLVDKDSGKDVAKSEVYLKLPDGWKSDGGDNRTNESADKVGKAPNLQRIAHFKDITSGGTDADKCKIESIEVDEVLEFDSLTAG
jgi:hypothetical protein